MKKIYLVLICFLLSSFSHAYEFKHFKLTKSFQAKKDQLKQNEMSPVLDKVWDKLKDQGIKQLNKITADILEFNQDFTLGDYNAPEVQWAMQVDTELGVKIGRKVEPTLESDHWLVQDRMELVISAGALLAKMRDAGEIEISKDTLKLFAGVSFVRVYNYDHFANSYLEGLKSDFRKLLLSFTYFSKTNFTTISEGDVITKEDFFSANAEFSVSTPSLYMMAGFGKGSIYFSKLASVSYHRPLPELRYGELDAMRMHYNVTKLTGAGLQLGLQADFYELLNLTLLGAEYKVNYEKNTTTNMTFGERDLINIKTDYNLEAAFSQINRGKNPKQIPIVDEYITSTEEGYRVSEELNMYAFMWGKYVGNSHGKFHFNTQKGDFYFHRYTKESAKLSKSWWDGIFNADNVNKYNTRHVENIVFEYDVPDLEQSFEDSFLDENSSVSFRLTKQYKTKKDKQKYRQKAIQLLSHIENIDAQIIDGLQNETIRGPLTLDLNAHVSSQGIFHLLRADLHRLNSVFAKICEKSSQCLQKLEEKFQRISHEMFTQGSVKLLPIYDFLKVASHYSKSFADLQELFADINIQLYGSLQAQIPDSEIPFKTFFKLGQTQGQGAIKDFIKNIE